MEDKRFGSYCFNPMIFHSKPNKHVKTKRKPSFVCELLTCKGDKQVILEEARPQPDSGFLLPQGIFSYQVIARDNKSTNLIVCSVTLSLWPILMGHIKWLDDTNPLLKCQKILFNETACFNKTKSKTFCKTKVKLV